MTPAVFLLVASLSGHVTQITTNVPLAKAVVTLSPFNGGTGRSYKAATSSDGQFTFQNIDPGQYRLYATRNGFVGMEYGARAPEHPGLPITLNDGQQLGDVNLQLTPAGTIAGRIFDSDGEPLAKISVDALKSSYVEGRKILSVVQTAETNDLGEYRLFWLAPGNYFVRATPGPHDVIWKSETYIPVYYPDTANAQSATAINVAPGSVLNGVDMTAAMTATLKLHGQAINGITGQPVRGATVMVYPVRGTPILQDRANTPVGDQGRFTIDELVPGSYELVALANDGTSLRGRTFVEVARSDARNISLVLMPGVRVTGTVTMDEPSSQAVSQALLQMRVMLRPDPVTQEADALPAGPVAYNGTFTMEQIPLGDYRLTVSGMPENAYIKAARYAGTNILDDGLRIDGQLNEQLQIVVSRNAGTVTGTVQTEKLEPAANATVILIPDAPRRSRLDLYRMTTTDANGRFHLDGVPPGSYNAFSWDEIETGAWQDPDFIRAFEDRGQPVRIDEDGTSNIKLRLIPSRV